MASVQPTVDRSSAVSSLASRYQKVRDTSLRYASLLTAEDHVVQTMPDVSPTKWHLAHVTWFFERFVLEAFDDSYQRYDDQLHYLFNSYYYSAGDMHARGKRGLLSRPTVDEVCQFRQHVDDAMQSLLQRENGNAKLASRVILGLNHEQQHQELLLTDILHVFSCNPLLPAMNPDLKTPAASSATELKFKAGSHGLQSIGTDGREGFCFDNETPRHPVMVHEHQLANRLVTNSEYREFIKDGGYTNSSLWLSDGWSVINERGWNRPLYWSEDLGQEFTLAGQRDLDLNAPVTHISYYEADAFARWAGARLPLESEWELAASKQPVDGNFVEADYWQPVAGEGQWFGDVWEWTSSPYAAYPGFEPLEGSLGEYNGKFMCNQMTVRGGSCVSAADHLRATYRSFFYPDARWQFLGLRLAKDDR